MAFQENEAGQRSEILSRATSERPAEESLQKRAHELYLARGCEHGHDTEDWLFAEEQLRGEYGGRVGTKTTFVAGPGGVAKTAPTPDEDFIIAEEERTQVRATEKLKQERVSGRPSLWGVCITFCFSPLPRRTWFVAVRGSAQASDHPYSKTDLQSYR